MSLVHPIPVRSSLRCARSLGSCGMTGTTEQSVMGVLGVAVGAIVYSSQPFCFQTHRDSLANPDHIARILTFLSLAQF